jgi:hypothetical protein
MARRQDEGGGQPPPLAFRAGINATYREIFSVSSDPNAGASQNDLSQDHNIGGVADARLTILPQRPWGGAIFASYMRSILPNSVNADPDLSFNSDVVGAGAEIAMQPNSGTLDWHVGYSFNDTIFEESAGTPYDNIVHQAYMQGRWRFRPRTALIYDASLRFIDYTRNNVTQTSLDTSTPVRTRIGIEGLMTDRFGVLAEAGWGASFYDKAFAKEPQFDSIIAQGELRWYLSASPGIAKMTEIGLSLSQIAIGYTRDFQNSYLGSYYAQDRGYLKFSYQYGSNFVLTIQGGAGAIEYPDLFWNDGTLRHSGFSDTRVDATLFTEYRFTHTFGLNGTLRYSTNLSDQAIDISEPGTLGPMAPTGPASQYAMEWQRFEAHIGLRWFM